MRARRLAVMVPLVAALLALPGCGADAPPLISAAEAGDQQATVWWQPPLGMNAPLVAYVVTPWIAQTAQTSTRFDSSATSQIVTGLTNGTTYTFTVTAINALGTETAASEHSNPITPMAAPALDPVIATAGDVACSPTDGSYNGGSGTASACRQQYTSDLLVAGDFDAVLALGDLQYENGTESAFDASYDPSWGRVKDTTYPAPGNHEYNTPGATGYYSYFGAQAGDPSKGYYSFEIGTWHAIALNSNCGVVSCAAGSEQEQWLRADMTSHPATCTVAFWHHPRFSSDAQHGNNTAVQPLWQALSDGGADLALTGHAHDYERFAPQSATGRADPLGGVREFVVGTGGKNHYGFATPKPNSEVRHGTTFGVLRLGLHPAGYDWSFVPEAGATFSDAGSTACH